MNPTNDGNAKGSDSNADASVHVSTSIVEPSGADPSRSTSGKAAAELKESACDAPAVSMPLDQKISTIDNSARGSLRRSHKTGAAATAGPSEAVDDVEAVLADILQEQREKEVRP